jgi:hypothetical protein
MKQADRLTRARPGGFLHAAAVLPSCATRIRNNTSCLVPAHVAGRLRLCRSWPSALDRDTTCGIGDGLPDNLPDRDFSSAEEINLGLLPGGEAEREAVVALRCRRLHRRLCGRQPGGAAVASGHIVRAGGQSRGRRVAAPSRPNTPIQRQGCLVTPADAGGDPLGHDRDG